MLKTINWRKKNKLTQMLLDKYRSTLKINLQSMSIPKGSILLVRGGRDVAKENLNILKKEIAEVCGHDNFKLIYSPSYNQMDVILKDKMNIIIGRDILDAWKETKNLSAEERVKTFQKWIEDNGLCKGC